MTELRIITEHPLNAETPLDLQAGVLTPAGRHYVRSHFAVPVHPGTLRIDGAVARPRQVTVRDLVARRATTLTVTLECAGNGRRFLEPPAPGEPWGLGAVGTAEWTGVPLPELLDEAGLDSGAVEILFVGADSGSVPALGREIAFERSLPVDVAQSALVAHSMNGEPLAPDHGAPLRLIVPGRYGMASVKWLSRISAVVESFRGFFQVARYVIDGEAIGPIAPRAIIVAPAGGMLPSGVEQVIRGFAWSGRGPIERVDVSVDGGVTWREAELTPAGGASAWRPWLLRWRPTAQGQAVILARATDAAGDRQPLEQVSNALGYRNNAAQPVGVEIA